MTETVSAMELSPEQSSPVEKSFVAVSASDQTPSQYALTSKDQSRSPIHEVSESAISQPKDFPTEVSRNDGMPPKTSSLEVPTQPTEGATGSIEAQLNNAPPIKQKDQESSDKPVVEDGGISGDAKEVQETNDVVEQAKEGPERFKQHVKYIELMEERVASLEKKIEKIEGVDAAKTSSEAPLERFPAIPRLRRVNWHNFKNDVDEPERVFAIDVLVEAPKYYYERTKEERKKKEPLSDGEIQTEYMKLTGMPFKDATEAPKEIPERIRINSDPIISVLSELLSENLELIPIVVLRPYKIFVYYENEIRDTLRKLEAKWADADNIPPSDNKTNDNTKSPRKINPNPSHAELIDSVEALEDLRCLVQFIDLELRPVVDSYKGASRQKVRFWELWYLFMPGKEVFAPLGSQDLGPRDPEVNALVDNEQPMPKKSLERYQTVWRVVNTTGGRANLSPDVKGDDVISPRKVQANPFFLLCYYVDFNGERFQPVTYIFSIKPFEGEKDITSLEIYPLLYAENATEIRDQLRDRGERFREFTTFKHKYYTGPTYIHHPCGRPFQSDDLGRPENVDSQVIVDFSETLHAHPDWFLWYTSRDALTMNPRECDDAYPVSVWKDRDQKELDYLEDEVLLNDVKADGLFMGDFIASDLFLGPGGAGRLHENDLVLLPSRVFAFVLKTRKFALLDIEKLRPVKNQKEGFNNLKLPPGHKRMVQALVKSHFNEKGSKSADIQEDFDFDLVRGKGKGLIVLLHGAPECVAESNGKPLFPITCGDLGLTAGEIEKELAEKFHLAQQWDCVLLLDEADVFLARRNKTDIQRNSLVSVFLRVLEYYTGILFLTTNRVGAFDEAFKSRIHISLYYPPLFEAQTQEIWKMNIDRTMKRKKKGLDINRDGLLRFAADHYRESSRKEASWNGRQIRNAFQTAVALAEYEAQDQRRKTDPANADPMPVRLGKEHFETVAAASMEFDLYMKGATGFDDAERSYMSGDRADHHKTSYNYRERGIVTRPGTSPFGQEQYQQSSHTAVRAMPYRQGLHDSPSSTAHHQAPHQFPYSQPNTPNNKATQPQQGQYATQEPSYPLFQQSNPRSPLHQQSYQMGPGSNMYSADTPTEEMLFSANKTGNEYEDEDY
ncbi:MAG: hypothetical protein Q9187_004778 [Circinaria calcarea]